uniref:Uncharacterized protein n=1 Tax=Glossina pallidipes TaxID=7398 RepID=A0A1B0AGG9_GLOPL
MLAASCQHSYSNKILSITAMLSGENVFLNYYYYYFVFNEIFQELWVQTLVIKVVDLHRFAHVDGDHLTLLNVHHAFKQNNIKTNISPAGSEDPNWCHENFINF